MLAGKAKELSTSPPRPRTLAEWPLPMAYAALRTDQFAKPPFHSFTFVALYRATDGLSSSLSRGPSCRTVVNYTA